MLNIVYERLQDVYSCTLSSNPNTKSIQIDVGSGFILTVTCETRIGSFIFKIVSNRGSRPVYIDCPIDDKGHTDLIPLYCFIDDFSSLL